VPNKDDEVRPGYGNCHSASLDMSIADPSLLLRVGYYRCTEDGLTYAHWWCEDVSGKVHDPTADQFLSKGSGEYRWIIPGCEICGNDVDVQSGTTAVCSGRCHAAMVGVSI